MPDPSEVLIDLEADDPRPAELGARRRVSALGVVALVLAGVLAGAAGMHVWSVAQQRNRDAAEVTLFVAVASFGSAGGDNERVVINGTVAVVNGGPMPVEVSPGADMTSLMLAGHQRIEPGATGWFTGNAFVVCSGGALRPLPVELSVLTADGRRREVTLGLQLFGSRWHEEVVQACTPHR